MAQETKCDCDLGEMWAGQSKLNNLITVYALIKYSLLESYLYSFNSLPNRCDLTCIWSLIVALFHMSIFLPSNTDQVQYKSVKTDLVQITNNLKVWSG
jgi:hypothetical protein